LYGGVDGNNLVVPMDSAGYAQYSTVRPPASNVNLTQAELLQIQPATGGAPYGLHPQLTELQPLFAQGKLAILANVGPLTQPTTKTNYLTVRPQNLFSHSDQQNQWQSSVSAGVSRSGWGGRIADQLQGQNGAGIPVVTSIAGTSLFTAGDNSSPLAVATNGGLALQGINNSAAATARLAALNTILGADRDNTYVKAAGDITTQALSLSATVNPILSSTSSTLTALFDGQNSSIADQLLAVAKLIEARAQTGARRQV